MPILIKVEIIHDNEANVYVATSPDLKGLVVEAETLDELEKDTGGWLGLMNSFP